MKAILKFDLSNIDDRQEHFRCVKASDMASVLFEFGSNCRKTIEREFESKTEEVDVYDGIDKCLEHFYRLLQEHNINIDELYT